MKAYADWYIARQAEEAGMLVSMSFIRQPKRTELHDKLYAYFLEQKPDHETLYDEDDCGDILYNINDYFDDNNIDKVIDFPYSEGTDIHLVKITDNLQLQVTVADEYYGSGDYNKYIAIDRFMINEKTTEQDVDKLIEFIREYLEVV